jgi:hypothetical protein
LSSTETKQKSVRLKWLPGRRARRAIDAADISHCTRDAEGRDMERQLKATAADPAMVPCDGPAAARGRRLIAGARSAVSAIAVMLVAGASPASAAPVFFVTDTTDAPD